MPGVLKGKQLFPIFLKFTTHCRGNSPSKGRGPAMNTMSLALQTVHGKAWLALRVLNR